jgi:hypothetical protein
MADIELNATEIQRLKDVQMGRVVEMHIMRRLEDLGLIENKRRGWVIRDHWTVTGLGETQLARAH